MMVGVGSGFSLRNWNKEDPSEPFPEEIACKILMEKKRIRSAIKAISWNRFGRWTENVSNGVLTSFHHRQAAGPSELIVPACSLAPRHGSSAACGHDIYEGWCPASRCLLDSAEVSEEVTVSSCPSWCSAAGRLAEERMESDEFRGSGK